jgi:hypothetical protein
MSHIITQELQMFTQKSYTRLVFDAYCTKECHASSQSGSAL